MQSAIVEVVRTFRAMNTDVEAVVCVPAGQLIAGEIALGRVEVLFAEAEKALSRFRPDSELALLNARSGSDFKASPLLFGALEVAMEAARVTNGLVDPTVLPCLIESGYDRSFEVVPSQRAAGDCVSSNRRCSWRDVLMDHARSIVRIPSGCGIDLGGSAKGWTVERSRSLLDAFPGYAIDAGGDIAVGGVRADGSAWTIGIADPQRGDQDLQVLKLSWGAVCTSSSARRRWRVGDEWRHHIIDPRTGRPSDSPVVSATVIADSATLAESLSKAALLLGPREGVEFVLRHSPSRCVLVLDSGQIIDSAAAEPCERVSHVA
ncbi:MAG: FAD:protein FMN transferase [Dehalococcoidia bacterium]|nr:FAD:protein FMN transferase [Dehalococcoidia bacterium]